MKYLRLIAFVMIVLTGGSAFAAPSLDAVKKNINKAGKLWENDAEKAQKLLDQAFADAISWTRPDFVDSVREQGFYQAVSCCCPELADEVVLAAETYLKTFPQGKHRRNVNLFLAMAAYSLNDFSKAEKALNEAAAAGRLGYSQQSFVLSGYFAGGKHRTAEHFIEGQQLVNPSARLKKDLRRFHSGNRLIEGLLKKVASGKIQANDAVISLDTALQNSWFAKKAPEAALVSLGIRDKQAPFYNSLRTSWFDLERVVKHGTSPQLRQKKLEAFIADFPQASADERFKAMVELYYLYRLEFRDSEKAEKLMSEISGTADFGGRAEIESIINRLDVPSLRNESGFADLKRLRELAWLLPYDNGIMPVITMDKVVYLSAIADMIQDKASQLPELNMSGWKNLPVSVLYAAATGQKEKARELFAAVEKSFIPQIGRLFSDTVYPLYKPVRKHERLFLAGLASIEALPDLGVDLVNEAIEGRPRMLKAEHGLAVLADVYNRHMAYAEAQKVWNLLTEFYPDSVWLK
jgi:hypothetical protein